MSEQFSVFHSEYIIDGIRMEQTPAQVLEESIVGGFSLPVEGRVGQIVDEPANPCPGACRYDTNDCDKYLALVRRSLASSFRNVPPAFSGAFSKLAIARCLIDCIWSEGHFSLDEMTLRLGWNWDCAPVGNMAAFYFSAEAAGQYLYDLGVKIRECSFSFSESGNIFSVGDPEIWHETLDEDFSSEDAAEGFRLCEDMSGNTPFVEKTGQRKCPEFVQKESRSWIIYIPFDTCHYRLGGSVLAELCGENGDAAPEVRDPDYFIDCYEVVRELVEDGVIIAGVTVADGGLMAASDNFCSKIGCELDVSGIESAYSEKDRVRILFSEVPGVLVQIRDSDFDYVDSQLLLQDIAYYPLGHPELAGGCGVRVSGEGRPDVMSILSALLQEQQSEGED